MSDLDELEEIAELRRKRQLEAEAIAEAQGSPWQDLLTGVAGGLVSAIKGGGDHASKFLALKGDREKADRDRRLKALESTDATIKALADVAKERKRGEETDRRYSESAASQQRNFDQQMKLQEMREAARLSGKAPKGMTYATNPETGEQTLVPQARQLAADKVLSVNEGNTIPRMLGDIRESINQNADVFGPVSGLVASANPWNEKAGTLDAQMRMSSQAFGRFMEGGVLRKEDEDKYRKMFPQLSDTKEIAQNKLDLVERLLAQKQNSNLAALSASGWDTGGVKGPGLNVPVVPKSIRPGLGNPGEAVAAGAPARVPVKTLRNKRTGQVKVIYSDGTEEIK